MNEQQEFEEGKKRWKEVLVLPLMSSEESKSDEETDGRAPGASSV